MVIGTAVRSVGRLGLVWTLSNWGGAGTLAAGETTDRRGEVRAALERGAYPWYDPKTDGVVWRKIAEPWKPDWGRRLDVGTISWAWSDYLVLVGFLVAFVALAWLIVRYWNRVGPTGEAGLEPSSRRAEGASGAVLPPGLRGQAAIDDPWAEADRRRQSGDFAGAAVCLFAHQLLSLARLGLVRLAPGRTGRQLHRSVTDRELRSLMLPTLRQFEAVYYGHRTPSGTDFAAVWTAAEAFERRLAERETR